MKLTFIISDWKIIPSRNVLISPGGEEHKVEPKVMEVLLLMIQADGETVSKEKLLETVWDDTIVTEYSLSRAISKLRKVFNDDARNPSVIETIPKTGYRLIPSIQKRTDLSPAGSEPAQSANKTFSILLLLVALTGIAVIFYTFFNSFNKGYKISDSDLSWINTAKIIPLTSGSGNEINPDIHPVSGAIVYAQRNTDENQFDLFVQLLDEDTPVIFANTTDSETQPKFSSDGNTIYYIENGNAIISRPYPGGNRSVLFRASEDDRISHIEPASNRSELVFSMATRQGPYRVFVLNLQNGDIRPLTHPDNDDFGDQQPVYSPNGNKIAFGRMTLSGVRDIWIYHKNEERAEQITHDRVQIHGIEWLDNENLLFVSNRTGIFSLWTVNLMDKENIALESNLYDIENPVISEQADMIAFEKWDTNINITRVFGYLEGTPSFQKPLDANRIDNNASISPNQQYLAYSSNRSGTSEIWVRNLDTGNDRRISNLSRPYTAKPSWSPDGSMLAFESRINGLSGIYLTNIEGNELDLITSNGKHLHGPRFSPDGNLLYYLISDGDSTQVFSKNLHNGSQINHGEIVTEIIKTDRNGKPNVLYYLDEESLRIKKYDVNTRHQEVVSERSFPSGWQNWMVHNDTLYYFEWQNNRYPFYSYPISSGEESLLFEVNNLYKNSGLSYNPEDRSFYFATVDEQDSDIILLQKNN